MPIYEYKCNMCGKEKEFITYKYQPVTAFKCASHNCVGGEMKLKISLNGQPNYGFKPFTTENITGYPVQINGRAQKKRLLKRHGLEEAG